MIAIGAIELHPARPLVLKRAAGPSHSGRPVPHQRLLTLVWGNEYQGELEYLRTLVSQIRKKIEDDLANPKYLLTDAYVGYRFCEAN